MPSAYVYKIFGLSLSSKSLLYLLAAQLFFAQPPKSIVSAVCGLLAGLLYTNNFLGSQQWRFPKLVQRIAARIFSPLLTSERMPRRSTRTSLDDVEFPQHDAPRQAAIPRPTGAAARQGAISEVVQTL